MLAHAAEVKNKRYREGLLGNMEAARQSRELATIRIDVPVEFDAEQMRYRAGLREAAFAIFNELGFRALAKEYAPTAETIEKAYRIVNTEEQLAALASRLKTAGRFALRHCGVDEAVIHRAQRGQQLIEPGRPVGHACLDRDRAAIHREHDADA